MSITAVTLEPSLVKLIDDKAIAECGDKALLQSSTFIRQLNDHINAISHLASDEILTRINYLVGCLTITLDIPMCDLEFIRARRCEMGNFKYVKELSYIDDTTESFPCMGRLNKAGQSLFYAAIAVKQDDTALRVVLSEVGAKAPDHLNAIRFRQSKNCELNLRVMGIWDNVRRGDKPYYLANHQYNYYKKAKDRMDQKFAPSLLSAYELTDRFLADILSRKGTVTLYQVTSAISSVILGGGFCDGVLYSSVEAKGEPVVALTPQAVDAKLQYQWVSDVEVEQCFGYEFFQYKTLGKTVQIESEDGKLVWV